MLNTSSASESSFTTEPVYTLQEIASPALRVFCEKCPRSHLLITVEQSLGLSSEDVFSIPPEFAIVLSVFGHTREQTSDLLGRREITRLAPGQTASRILKAAASSVGRKAPALSARVGRNEPCPCGSGKKFKKCHAREGGKAQ
ncbi:MAG TPA: SEC-C metal-binding domain-containing protein [Thermoanaerobaculia bacterium]|nr:SEC-C metal-binding domain-containing protein [Thermoanaerobaculia bacterium]